VTDPLFFFGAGSSARFGIPTMKEMVRQFKEELTKQSGKDFEEEVQLYAGVEQVLREGFDRVDLEAVFSVIYGIAGGLTPKELWLPCDLLCQTSSRWRYSILHNLKSRMPLDAYSASFRIS
jgi:hypothetical protein